MTSERRLKFEVSFGRLQRWAANQSRLGDGWIESYPEIRQLVNEVCELCADASLVKPYANLADAVAVVISGTSESEMCIEAMHGYSVPDSVFQTLMGAGDWKCRWQICAYMDLSTVERQSLLLRATEDPCEYVVRRALLRLVELGHVDIAACAQKLADRSDPVIKATAEEILKKR